MSEDPFPSQSHKSREPKEIQRITTSDARIRKAPWGRRMRKSIIQGDAETVWTTMLWDTFFPNLADNIKDAVHNGVDALFGGYQTGARRSHRYNNGGGRYANSNVSRHNPDRALGGRNASSNDRFPDEARRLHDFSVIEIDSRVEAQEVINQLVAQIDQFDVVTVAEFLLMVGITPSNMDYKFGWEEMGGASVESSRGSYYLNLPQPIQLR